MVICQLDFLFQNLFVLWAGMLVIALAVLFTLSGIIFYRYYVCATYDTWLRKTNPKYPTAEMVRGEIYFMVKGAGVGIICPVLSLWMSANDNSYWKGYCGMKHGAGYEIFSFLFIWIFSDFYEFYYHKTGHSYDFFWSQHKSHHKFYNPSPFAVIADDCFDQLMRAAPLFFLPLMIPINMDLLFFEYTIFFYGYGIYLHWGHEYDWPDAHHPWINSSYHHYLHHAKSLGRTPYHCGFFFKIWDNMFDTVWKKDCFCVKCSAKKGERTREIWEKTKVPDYSPLLNPGFWVPWVFSGKAATA